MANGEANFSDHRGSSFLIAVEMPKKTGTMRSLYPVGRQGLAISATTSTWRRMPIPAASIF